jgi:hypothetical protein
MPKKAKYVVMESTPGYLAESEPGLFATFDEALSYARELVEELLDTDLGIENAMSLVNEFVEEPWASFEVVGPGEHDLGRVVEVSPTEEDIDMEE